MKIWTSNEKGNERIIAYIDDVIYRGNPKLAEIENVVYDLKMRNIPTKDFTGIPLRYLKAIDLQEGKEYIEILFGIDSYEHLRIKDKNVRQEIFDYFKLHLPNTTYTVVNYSKLKSSKKPLIAMLIIVLLFLWTIYLAFQIEKGNEYEISNGHYNSIAGIVLALASLGTKNVIVVFSTLFSIGLFSFIKKYKNPPVINKLVVRH